MTAIELQTELLQEIGPIVEDEGLMRKVINYVRKLVRTQDVEIDEGEDVRANLKEAFAELKDYQDGRINLQSADDFLNELRKV